MRSKIQILLTFPEIDSKTMWILKFVWKNSKIETAQKYLEVLSNLLEDTFFLLLNSSTINNSPSAWIYFLF